MLSGEKQRIERNYNFVEIAQWFAARWAAGREGVGQAGAPEGDWGTRKSPSPMSHPQPLTAAARPVRSVSPLPHSTRCDLIFLLFDPHKLDISDEFKQVITALRGHDDKASLTLLSRLAPSQRPACLALLLSLSRAL